MAPFVKKKGERTGGKNNYGTFLREPDSSTGSIKLALKLNNDGGRQFWDTATRKQGLEHLAAPKEKGPFTLKQLQSQGVRLFKCGPKTPTRIEIDIAPDARAVVVKHAAPACFNHDGHVATLLKRTDPANPFHRDNVALRHAAKLLRAAPRHIARVDTLSANRDGREYLEAHFSPSAEILGTGNRGSKNTGGGSKRLYSKYDGKEQRELDASNGKTKQDEYKKRLARLMASAVRSIGSHSRAGRLLRKIWDGSPKAPGIFADLFAENAEYVRGSGIFVLRNMASLIHTDHGLALVVQIVVASKPFYFYWPPFGVAILLEPGDVFVHDANWPHIGVRSDRRTSAASMEEEESWSFEMVYDLDAAHKLAKDYENAASQNEEGVYIFHGQPALCPSGPSLHTRGMKRASEERRGKMKRRRSGK
jgi:hypothetical protein